MVFGMSKSKGYEISKYPESRKIVLDLLEQSSKRHHVKGIITLDITEPRRIFRKYKEETGNSLSFTGWILACVGRAVNNHKEISAYKLKNRIYTFDDFDVGIVIEKELDGKKVPTKYILRRANEKSFKEIHEEIRSVQGESSDSPVLGSKKNKTTKTLAFFASLPKFARRIVWWYVNNRPPLRKKFLGTATITSIGMFAKIGGWAIAMSSETLHVMIGGISKRPVAIEDKVEVRECVDLTLMADHAVVDGGPFTRFVQDLSELVEEGYGLEEFT